MKKKAFTLVELTISAALLSLVVFAITSVYSGSSKSFNTSSWRMSRQKEAQILLLRFKEAMEKASHFNSIKATGVKERKSDVNVIIAGNYYNKIASAANTGIVFASHCTPHIESNPELQTTEKLAVFKGFSLECYDRNLAFVQTGDSNKLMATIKTFPMTALPPLENAKIKRNDTSSDSIVKVEDVDSIGVYVTHKNKLASETCLLTLKIIMRMPNTKGKSAVLVKEEITASISDRLNSSKDLAVISGSSIYATSNKRK